MTVAPPRLAETVAAGCTVSVGPGWGWLEQTLGAVRLAWKGYLTGGLETIEGAAAAERIAALVAGAATDAQLTAALAGLAGRFAFIAQAPGRTVAVVDRIRSIPLVYGAYRSGLRIDDRGRRLRDELGLGPADVDPAQALAAAMSGYTVGAATLYRGIVALRPGEALVVDAGGPRTLRWFLYDAWATEDMERPEQALSDLNRTLMERLKRSAAGRAICVPLSAGYDSRLIAAGLKAVGAKDVRLFSYGRAGNHEAEAARQIAERLGYPWRFVPFTARGQAALFRDEAHERALWEESDSLTAVPFEQDWTAVVALRAAGYIPADAVMVNGQTGDFISGNHAPPALMDAPAGEGAMARRERVVQAYVAKHFRLWRALASPDNDAVVGALVAAEAEAAGAQFSDAEALHGIHEMLEYQDRQAKYVVSGQRTYEALDLSWRLPLWDDDYIAFWRRAAAGLKRNQSLYRRVLEADNWAGVFADIPVNRKTIQPAWIRPVRLLAKAVYAPLGAARWHAAERRLFQWWMDPLCTSAVVPYTRAVRDKRGARHGVSWLCERWLGQHGVSVPPATIGSVRS